MAAGAIVVQTSFLWISRVYLWISNPSCGEVEANYQFCKERDPHMWTPKNGFSNMWIGLSRSIFADWNVNKFSESFPQRRCALLMETGPTSRVRRARASTGGVDSLPCISIHIIHSPYYYYDSYLFFNKILESIS